MSRLATRAEVLKLARALELDPSELDFLRAMPAEQLRAVRVALYERLFDDNRALAERTGAIAARLPAQASLRLAERLGPLVIAVAAAEMPTRRAADLSTAISIETLADVAEELDPRRTRDVLRQLPGERLVALARELVARGDHMTASRFVDFVSDANLVAIEDAIEDEADLLRIAFFIGSKNRLDHLFTMLPPERLERLILRVEDGAEELLPAFMTLLGHVSYELRRDLGDLLAAQEPRIIEGYIRAAYDQELWAEVLPAVAAMLPEARTTVVNLGVLREREVQESIIAASDTHDLWGVVLPMIELMDDSNRGAVAAIIAARERTTLENAADAALMGEHWGTLIDLVRRTPATKQGELEEIVRGYGEVDPALADRILGAAGVAPD